MRLSYGRAHIGPLYRGVVMRDWDLARAAKAEKVGFGRKSQVIFLFFHLGRCARRGGLRRAFDSNVLVASAPAHGSVTGHLSNVRLARIIRSLARTRHVSPAERFFGDLEQVGANRPLSPAGRAGF
jgi:hypothetical protein